MKRIIILWVMCCLGLFTHTKADNWMSRLPDDALVAEVSIPGAHDAATGSGWHGLWGFVGNHFAKTQDLTMQELWDVGVRAFDLRPAVYKDHIQLNHGMVPTRLHLDEVLRQMCGWLKDNPSEWIVIHLLHAADGDKVKGVYEQRIAQLLQQKEWSERMIRFRANLKVRDMRGKILILSRNHIEELNVGGQMSGWSGSPQWQNQTGGQIWGANGQMAHLHMQDYSSTYREGALDRKKDALVRMLDFTTKHKSRQTDDIVWIFNFASAYSKVLKIFGNEISLSNGYRDNAVATHSTMLHYLEQHHTGTTGIVLMDYAGVDRSHGYQVNGLQLVNAIIQYNFK